MIKSYLYYRENMGRLPLYHLDVYRIGDDPDSIDWMTFCLVKPPSLSAAGYLKR